MAYFSNLKRGISTTYKGLSLTLKHIWAAKTQKVSHNIQDTGYFENADGIATLQYPYQKLDIPEIGRYQLDCEIDDCIVCDKCAKVCPVDCIEIEAIKSPELIRNTSDGSPVRLYAAKFDIDMAKCCFCGLCTTVCPTECLTMNSEYDYSVDDVSMLNFAFSNLKKEEAEEKRALYEQFVKEKAEVNLVKTIPSEESKPEGFRPSFKPKMPSTVPDQTKEKIADEPKPTFKPSFKPKPIVKVEEVKEEEVKEEEVKTGELKKPTFMPKQKPIMNDNETSVSQSTEEATKVPVKFTPKRR